MKDATTADELEDYIVSRSGALIPWACVWRTHN